MNVAICTVTYNRRGLAARCVGPSLSRAGYPFTWYHWDNGSTDDVFLELVRQVNRIQKRCYQHHENIGYAKAVNQLMLRAYDGYDGKADYFLVLDPDILITTQDWLAKMMDVVPHISNTGVAGIYCGVFNLHPLQDVNGQNVHVGNPYGPKMWSREVIDEIGWLCEDYGLYGNEDCDWLWRLTRANRTSYYVSGIVATHEGNDVGDQSEYRKMKWEALASANVAFTKAQEKYDMTGDLYIPPPAYM